MKKLIFITSDYPYGKIGETFIETEILFLSQKFDEIHLVSCNSIDEERRAVPSNVLLYRFNLYPKGVNKLFSLKYVFHAAFWGEVFSVLKRKVPISMKVLTHLLSSLLKAKTMCAYLEKTILSQNNMQDENTWIYSYWLSDAAVGIGMLKAKKPKIKAFSRAHGWDLFFEANPFSYLPMREYLIKKLDAIFFISNQGQEYFKKRFHDMPDFFYKFKISRLGVFSNDLDNICNNSDEFVLVSCSDVIRLKRLDIIVDALSKIDTVNIKWVHFGDGPLMAELKEKVHLLLDSRPNINYILPGIVTNKVVYSFYSAEQVDCFINVSEREGLPVSIMEAMSVGIPVIATNVGGTGEIVDDTNGFLLSKDISPDELAQTLVKLATMEASTILNYRKSAKDTWFNFYNAEKNYKYFVDQMLLL